MSRKREYLVARHQAERARRDRAVVRKQLTAVEGVVTSQRLTVIDPSPAVELSTTGAVEQASEKTCFKCGRTGKQSFDKVGTVYCCKSRIACDRRQPVL